MQHCERCSVSLCSSVTSVTIRLYSHDFRSVKSFPADSHVTQRIPLLSDSPLLPDWLQLWERDNERHNSEFTWRCDWTTDTAGFNIHIHLVLHHLQSAEGVFCCILRNQNSFNLNNCFKIVEMTSQSDIQLLLCFKAHHKVLMKHLHIQATAGVFQVNMKWHSQPILLQKCQELLSDMRMTTDTSQIISVITQNS